VSQSDFKLEVKPRQRDEAMTLFRLDASIRAEGSASREIADIVEQEWLAAHPGETIERRHIGVDVLPADAWGHAVSAGYVAAEARTGEQAAAVKLATTLTDELVNADAVLLAVPLYNWGVSQHIKVWFDLIMTDPRVRQPEPLLQGKPVVLVAVRGGGYAPGTPKHGWDHSTPYLRRMLGDLWGADLTVVERELTLAEVNPVMEPLRPLAAQMHAEALEAGQVAGRAFGVVPSP
jgi:FMN-dependent NADH-azoreductase